jgi:hypothetical protein
LTRASGRSTFSTSSGPLNKVDFSLQDVYAFAAQLQELHPDNRHMRDKIRQQLQVLRDLGLIAFVVGGRYGGL